MWETFFVCKPVSSESVSSIAGLQAAVSSRIYLQSAPGMLAEKLLQVSVLARWGLNSLTACMNASPKIRQ